VIIVIAIIVIVAMVYYIWKKRSSRYKFKKDEIFDEILDRGHLDSDD
jgi:FtsZ-interacting cell division protein ZipA